MTNAEFARTNDEFLKACEAVTHIDKDFKPSTRQASKWRHQKGLAYKTGRSLSQ